jgi:hypothetical protein
MALASGIAAQRALADAPAAAAPAATAAPAAQMTEAQASAQALALAVQRLSLTPDQAAKVKPLLDGYVTRLRRLFAGYTDGVAPVTPAFLDEFVKTRADFRGAVLPILSETQKVQYDRLRQDVDDSLRDMVSVQRLGALTKRLGLTPDQQTATRPILVNDFEKKRALIATDTGTTGGPQKGKALTDLVRDVQAETETKLAAVFTPQQMEIYRADLAAKVGTSGGSPARP